MSERISPGPRCEGGPPGRTTLSANPGQKTSPQEIGPQGARSGLCLISAVSFAAPPEISSIRASATREAVMSRASRSPSEQDDGPLT